MTDSERLAAEAEYFRLGALVGLDNGPEVISWADQQIAQRDSPPLPIIELASIQPNNRAALIEALAPIASPLDTSRAAVTSLLSRLYSELQSTTLTSHDAAQMLYHLSGRCASLSSDEQSSFCLATDHLEIQDRIYGNLLEAERNLLALLRPYRSDA